MILKELYNEAMMENKMSVVLLIDFLVQEKKTLTFDDDVTKLAFYLQDKFANRMNQYLEAYNEMMNIVSREKTKETFMIRYDDDFYYVVAYTSEQAEKYFQHHIGSPNSIEIMPESTVMFWGEEEIEMTIGEIANRQKEIPIIVGSGEI
jgi:hypothetical protein